ncbi:unnamed protein product, partial [Ectocarpus fasciculatus]
PAPCTRPPCPHSKLRSAVVGPIVLDSCTHIFNQSVYKWVFPLAPLSPAFQPSWPQMCHCKRSKNRNITRARHDSRTEGTTSWGQMRTSRTCKTSIMHRTTQSEYPPPNST